MGVTTNLINKPFNPRAQDQSPKGYNRAKLYSGKALDFDGVNDYVDGGTLDITDYTQMSVSFYMNVDTTTQDFRLISIRYSGADDIRIFHSVSVGAGVLNFSLDDGDVDNIGVNFETNQWYHVVMTHDGTTLKAYFNGVEQASTASAFDYANADGLFYIGRYTGGAVTYYDGQASNVKIFNTALTAAQVADLYNNPEKVVPTGVDNTALKLWLPMMEGAGTTAYDGSGNGNHGTISGATYVNGIGAPVAQSAVMDWNKGTNFYSDRDWAVPNATTNASISSPSHSAPNGIDTAAVFDDGTGSTYKRGYKVSNTAMAIGQITASTFVKKKDVDYINVVLGTDGGTYKFFALVDLVNGTINDTSGSLTATSIQSVGDGWYYVSVEAPHLSTTQGITYIYGQDPTNGSSVDESYTGANNETYIWGINIQEGAINNVHLPTIGTLQSSDVLLPQGLTTGRDITGVNLFENVRKQGALNLDGNSWAEVHDNESLDFGTGSFSLEAWARVKYVAQGSSYNVIMSMGLNISNAYSVGMIVNQQLEPIFIYNNTGTAESARTEGEWVHIVGTYDETNATIYVNGVQKDQDVRTAVDTTNPWVKHIGRDTTSVRYYNDQIAQPRIYNRALTAEEVQRNYNAGKNTYTN